MDRSRNYHAIFAATSASRHLALHKEYINRIYCPVSDPLDPEGIKPCSPCPLTKQKRDDCFIYSTNGEIECKDLVQAHKDWIWIQGVEKVGLESQTLYGRSYK